MYDIPCISLRMFGDNDKVRASPKIAQLRKGGFELTHIKRYLDRCRSRKAVMDGVFAEYRHWLRHPECLSLRDCVNVVTFNTGEKVQVFSNKLQLHILVDCEMCRGNGYYCEICKERDVIYSFQYRKVEQCAECKACFHSQCWAQMKGQCPRCQRRRKNLPQIK